MAALVAAFGSSHSVMLAAEREDWQERFRESDPRMPLYDRDGRPCTYAEVLAGAPTDAAALVTAEAISVRYDAVQAAMRLLADRVAGARLDALLIVGDDQHELFDDRHMPSIGIYTGATIRNAARTAVPPEDWYRRAQMRRLEEERDAHYPCHAPLARFLVDGLMARDFDLSTVAGLADDEYEGHAYSFVHRWYLRGQTVPVIPVFLNTYYPPNQPHPRRCVQFGAALRDLIAAYPEDLRVGVLASGGLSHFVVDEALDLGVIDALRRKDLAYLAGLEPRHLQAGSSEIRSWIVVAAAASALDLAWVSYTPAYRTPALTGTGLGFAAWQ